MRDFIQNPRQLLLISPTDFLSACVSTWQYFHGYTREYCRNEKLQFIVASKNNFCRFRDFLSNYFYSLFTIISKH